MARVTVRSNGTYLHSLGYVSPPTYSLAWPVGCVSASWEMRLPVGFTHPAIRQGAVVELMVGPLVVWSGRMAEPDRESWRFTADGFGMRFDKVAAVDGAGAPSTDISVVVAAAIARGWPISGGGPSGSLSPDSEAASNLNTLEDLLNEHTRQTGERWAVGPNRGLFVGPDSTAVRWVLTPGTPTLATADDDYASRVFVRYVSAVSGTPPEPSGWDAVDAEDAAARDRWGASEHIEDITSLGLLTELAAAGVARAMLDAGRARPAYTQGVELYRGRIMTPGGTPPEIWQVGYGDRVRQHGVLGMDGALAFGATREWVIGSVTVDTAENRLTIAPVGLLPRTQASVMAAQSRATERGFV